jgi:hypothetical protein
LLKSEQLRNQIVLGLVIAVAVVRLVRGAFIASHESLSLWLTIGCFVVLFVAYEFLTLRLVNGAIQTSEEPAIWVRFSNILLETSLSAFAVAFLSSASITQFIDDW